MVKEPVFPERELRIVTEANKQMYLVNAQRVEVMARKRLNRELFGPEHPLGRFAETEDYERLSAEMLKGFYRENYYSDNCTMFVAGRVTDIVLKCIEEHFGETPWGENRKKMNPLMPEPRGAVQKRVTVEKKDGMQSSVKIGCFLPDRMHEDFLDLKVMNTNQGGQGLYLRHRLGNSVVSGTEHAGDKHGDGQRVCGERYKRGEGGDGQAEEYTCRQG